jgi:hypothetical protein
MKRSPYAYDNATIDLMKRQIEAQLDDYERETREYAEFERVMRIKYEQNVSHETSERMA